MRNELNTVLALFAANFLTNSSRTLASTSTLHDALRLVTTQTPSKAGCSVGTHRRHNSRFSYVLNKITTLTSTRRTKFGNSYHLDWKRRVANNALESNGPYVAIAIRPRRECTLGILMRFIVNRHAALADGNSKRGGTLLAGH